MAMKSMLRVGLAVLSITCLSGAPGFAQSGVFDQIGINGEHGFHGALAEENVDLLTGNLTLSYTDVYLPGPLGFDLAIHRAYNSKVVQDVKVVDTNGSWQTAYILQGEPRSWVGLGWTLHMGRLLDWKDPIDCIPVGGGCVVPPPSPTIEFPDGRSEKPALSSDANGTQIYHTQSHLKLVRQNGVWTLYFQDGTRWLFGNPTQIQYEKGPRDALCVVQIVNPQGYHIDASYIDGKPCLQTVKDSMQREVDFLVDSTAAQFPKLQRVQIKNSEGVWVEYTYTVIEGDGGVVGTVYLLDRFKPPLLPAQVFHYDLALPTKCRFQLTGVDTGLGGHMGYTYEDHPFATGGAGGKQGPWGSRVLSTKTLDDGTGQTASWTYTYPKFERAGDDTVEIKKLNVRGVPELSYAKYSWPGENNLDPVIKAKWFVDQSFSEGYSWKALEILDTNLLNGYRWVYVSLIETVTTRTLPNHETVKQYSYNAKTEQYGLPSSIKHSSGQNTATHRYTEKLTYAFESDNALENAYKLSYVTNHTTWNPSETQKQKETITAYEWPGGAVKLVDRLTDGGNYLTWTYENQLADPKLITITTDLPGSAGRQIAKYDHGVQSQLKWENSFDVFTRTVSAHDSSILTERNQYGGTMTFTYDNLGRVEKVAMPAGFADIDPSWAADGKSVSIARGSSQIVKLWDGLGRDTGYTETDTKSGTTLHYRKKLDEEGRVTEESNGSLSDADVWKYSYKQAGDLWKTVPPHDDDDPVDHTTEISFAGEDKMVIDGRNLQWTYRYDHLTGLITRTTDPAQMSTEFTYDPIGRLTKAVIGGSRTHTYDHNCMDQVTTETHPETGRIDYTYNPSTGNLDTKTWATTRTSYHYNSRNQLTGLDSGDDAISYGYSDTDGTLRLIESTTKGWKRTITAYNPFGLIETETITIPGLGAKKLEYRYDANNTLAKVIYPDGTTADYTNNGFDAPELVKLNGGRLVDSVVYGGYKQPASIGFANGTALTADYLNSGHLWWTNLARGGEAYYHAQYRYDGNYNIKTIEGTTPKIDVDFQYDSRNRLKTASYRQNDGRVTGITYDTDDFGNIWRITESSTTVASKVAFEHTSTGKNQLTGWPYDGRGNLKSDGVYQYVWDNMNRLAEVRNLNAEAGIDISTIMASMDGDAAPDAGTAEAPLLASYLYDDRGLRLKTDRSPQGTVLVAEIVLDYPNGGQTLYVGKQSEIRWHSTNVATVRIELLISVGNATQIKVIKASFDASLGKCSWTPDTPGGKCYIRISNTAGSEQDTSDGPFAILQKKLTVDQPNGGEHWEAFTEHNIVWRAEGDFGTQTMAIKYSTNNGTSWKPVEGANALDPKRKSFRWTVPNEPSEQCLIRIHTGNEDTEDRGDGTFTIEPSNREIKVVYPNGGRASPHLPDQERQTFKVGDKVTITWELTGHFVTGKGLKVSLVDESTNAPTVVTIAQVGYVTSCQWTVNDRPGSVFRIRVEDLATGVKDESDEHFRIVAAPATLKVTKPAGGELLGVGSKYRIEWEATSVSQCQNVRIDYIRNLPDHEIDVHEIVPSIENSGHYLWEVPPVPEGLPQEGWRIRVADPRDMDPEAKSGPFSIVPPQMALKVEWPNGKNDGLTIGTKVTIKWNPGDTTRIENVKVSLSRTGNSPYSESLHEGHESVANDGELPWIVTGPASTDCRIEIRDADGVTADTSDAKFPINDGFTIKKPVGGDVLRIGKSYTIKWSPRDMPKNVKIQIKRDGGDWKHIDPKNTTYTNEGSLNWIVSEPEAGECYLRVSDASNMKFCGETKEPFSIRPSITVTSPNGGEQLKVGTTATIAWTTGGNVPKVNIDISRNNGQSWSRIKAGLTNTGTLPWPVVTPTSTKCLIRVSDTDKDPWDESDNTFSIVKIVTGARGTGTGFQVPIGEEQEGEALMGGIGEGEMALPPEDAAPDAYVLRPGGDEPQETDGWVYVRDEEGLPDYEYQVPASDGAWDDSVDYPYDDEPEYVPQTQPGGEPAGTGDGGGGGVPSPTPGAEITYYIYSFDGKLMAEYDSDGYCNRDYIYAGSRMLAEWRPKTAQKFYYMQDQINSTRMVTNGSGDRIYSAAYDPYGGPQKVWIDTYSPALGFSGKERDKDTGADYFGARWFAHGQYRWISTDPVIARDMAIVSPQLWNMYSYCWNNPVVVVDPDGRFAWIAVIIAVGYTLLSDSQPANAPPTAEQLVASHPENVFGHSMIGAALGLAADALLPSHGSAGAIATELESLAASNGPMTEVVTSLSRAPEAGRALSVATGEGAKQLAMQAGPGRQLFTGKIPTALINKLQTMKLASRSVTMMNGEVATEIRFTADATKYIIPFLH
ncbi:MAG: RHS repeat-associated core domain-containing protein [Acidobacteriota bacterium]